MVNFEQPEEKRGESKKLSVEAKKVVQKTANLLQSAKKINSDKFNKVLKKTKVKDFDKAKSLIDRAYNEA